MKALKSQLASELLADPTARDQLRQFMTSKRDTVQLARQATIVPKAKAA